MRRLAAAGVSALATGALLVPLGLLAVPLLSDAAFQAAAADTTSSWAAYVPAEYAPWYAKSAAQCDGLHPALLAAQGYVESGFNPGALSPAGAQGIAQFLPATYAQWGADADGDGTNSPHDPQDAIMAQGRFLCHLLGQALAAGLPGDPIALALAGYHAGWHAVLTHHGVPPYPATAAYIDTVTSLAIAWATQLPGRGGTGSFHDGTDTIPLPRANPRSTTQAIAWAHAAVHGPAQWQRLCLNFVARAYGWTHSGTPTALEHWRTMPAEYRHRGDRTPPPGALLYWATGDPAGHVALYLGDGLVASNDILRTGAIDIVPAELIEQRWGAAYLGWTSPYFPNGT